ncbi:MAG: quinone-dependent dihydroorotate dehydrogenase [Anaerolineales bacterium]|jgi:dihydroorotate dehydrogenase
MYKGLIRPILFRLPPEAAHRLTLKLIGLSGKVSVLRDLLSRLYMPKPTPVQVFGLTFPNLVGLAAGYDKDAEAIAGLSALGFGHIEVGTITPEPQTGNPKPRVFRLQADGGIINRMGFPGNGAEKALKQLGKHNYLNAIIGINIGKNKDTPLVRAAGDYTFLVKKFSRYADYLAINISSPNTVGLRKLQHQKYLDALLQEIGAAKQEQEKLLDKKIPLLVKLSPDMESGELDNALEAITASQIDGIIATNTTIARPKLQSHFRAETGGLSGEPLRERATQTIAHIARHTNGNLPIIGVGGIASPQDAQEKLDAGAVLVQVYTGLIYQGPGLVRRIVEQTFSNNIIRDV